MDALFGPLSQFPQSQKYRTAIWGKIGIIYAPQSYQNLCATNQLFDRFVFRPINAIMESLFKSVIKFLSIGNFLKCSTFLLNPMSATSVPVFELQFSLYSKKEYSYWGDPHSWLVALINLDWVLRGRVFSLCSRAWLTASCSRIGTRTGDNRQNAGIFSVLLT